MSKMTIALEIEDKDSPLVNKLMQSFTEGESVDGVKVYAAAHECLFEQVERLEDEIEQFEATLAGDDW